VNLFRFAHWIILLALFSALEFNCGAATNDFFAAGVAAFESGQFSDAAKNFRADAGTQPAAGTLVNLGLAEWRRGRAGEAILAWEQASWIDAFDSSARANLQYARDFASLEPPDYSWYERVSTWLPVNAWAWIAGASLWMAIGLSVVPGVLRRRKSGWQQALASLALALFILCLPAHFGVFTRMKIGFVLQKDSPLCLTPTAESEVIAKLDDGEPVRELRSRGGYVFVRTSRGQGWMERSQFGRVCPE
jgi:hypothetical protein